MSRMPHLIAAMMIALPLGIARADEPAAPTTQDQAAAEPPSTAPAPQPPAITVRGKVTDPRTGEGLPAAYVQVKGAEAQTIATELDGTFQLALRPGTYRLVFSTPEYDELTKTIVVTDSKVLDVAVALSPTVVAGKAETIEVTGTIDTRRESAALAVRRAAP